ncbi:rCG49363 [Rattus norvegicus]|uniref:RCG49363 n=1 Tax=Rattus norvegicus TaxID=10116 RepID=A6J2F0_RAT|nr:rCG49363 [Rattus norvegicus]
MYSIVMGLVTLIRARVFYPYDLTGKFNKQD